MKHICIWKSISAVFIAISTLPGHSQQSAAPQRHVTAEVSSATTPAAATDVTSTGGMASYVPKFSGAYTIVNSQIYDNGTSVGIGDVPNPVAKLDVNPADGRTLAIEPYQALFALLGVDFGGDGTSNFDVPDLRAFAPKGLQYSICAYGTFPTVN